VVGALLDGAEEAILFADSSGVNPEGWLVALRISKRKEYEHAITMATGTRFWTARQGVWPETLQRQAGCMALSMCSLPSPSRIQFQLQNGAYMR
jgi:hypothetical protein